MERVIPHPSQHRLRIQEFCTRKRGFFVEDQWERNPIRSMIQVEGQKGKLRQSRHSVKSEHEFRLPQKRDAARVQFISDNVYRLAAIDPRRNRATETGLYFASPVFIPK